MGSLIGEPEERQAAARSQAAGLEHEIAALTGWPEAERNRLDEERPGLFTSSARRTVPGSAGGQLPVFNGLFFLHSMVPADAKRGKKSPDGTLRHRRRP